MQSNKSLAVKNNTTIQIKSDENPKERKEFAE
jgi:hypothetical protein